MRPEGDTSPPPSEGAWLATWRAMRLDVHLALIVCFGLGCATAPKAPAGGGACALGVPGATVAAADTIGGLSLTFTAKDRTPELRARVKDAAAMFGKGEHLGQGHEGTHGHGGGHGLHAESLPKATATVEEVDGGARIDFMPADQADREALRAQLRERETAMNAPCEAGG